MFASKSGKRIRRLWEGDRSGYSSPSEADQALCNYLAFWTDRDPVRMDSLFRQSGLVRDKWEREDYRQRTIGTAIEATPEGYATPSRDPVPPRPRVTPSPVPTPSGGDGDDHPVPDPVPGPSRAPHSWHPVDIVARRANPPAPPEIIGLFYPGYNHLVSGESEGLKTWLAIAASASELEAGRGVLWVDGDDVGDGAILERLHAFGVEDETITRLFAYMAPDEPLTEDRLPDVLEVVRARACRLAVLDGFNPLLGLHSLDPNSGQEVELFYRLINPIRKLGVANVLNDNVVKAREARGAWAIGSERKKSKAEVHLGMRTLESLVRGGTGKAKIDVHKDRAGHLDRPSPGVFVVESDGERCTWRIQPDESRTEEGEFRPTRLMEKVSRYLELRGEPQTQSTIETDVQGKATYLRAAIKCLISEGYAEEFEGPRNARLVRLKRAFREEEDEDL